MKKTEHSNYRVCIDVAEKRPFISLRGGEIVHGSDHDAWLRAAEEIKKQVTRHCDEIGQVWVDFDTETSCEFCGCRWEDPPGCCDKAIEEWDAVQAVAQAARTAAA
jgi:hypothetical protein